ncbi:hypothetical protein PHI105_00235 [Bacillus phage phi105]|uniref:Uncharacterized protein n=1 Tax=Bacillus phage phi105 TaxID=10717 RepID=D6R429_BPPH1|nr:hypothetical protein HWA84_gp47 [Bacillus phage phi105]ADF59180.1 hypothetical protein PHI105_00235 [Bacillus phage phi105]
MLFLSTNSRQNGGQIGGEKGGLFMFEISINLTYQQNTGDAPNPYQWRIRIRNKGVEE